MKLADWARKNGIDYKTAYRLYRSGQFPVPTQQLPTGTILVHELPTITDNTAYMPEYLHPIRRRTWIGNFRGCVNMPQ